MAAILDRIGCIQTTFRKWKEIAIKENDAEQLNKALLNLKSEFSSIAYEGASMALALKSIKNNSRLEQWTDFYHKHKSKHAVQILIGLGWALSELNLHPSKFNLEIEALLKYRILDGYGYNNGVFKRRETIRTQTSPPNFNPLELKAFDQGLGRSLWYISLGEIEKLVKLINLFATDRRHDLWRGSGIAVAYVGGIENYKLQELTRKADEYLPSFKCGVSLLIQSRSKAKSISHDTENISNYLFQKNSETINKYLKDFEKTTKSSAHELYFDWLKRIESTLCQ